MVFKHSTWKRDAGFEARNVMKSHKDHSRDFRTPTVRTATRFTCAGSSATRCGLGSIARLKPPRTHSRTPRRMQHLSMSPSMYLILFLPVYQRTRILLYHYIQITTNNDNVSNTTIDFDFDDTPDSDSNDEDDSNDISDHEEESILTGVTTPLAPKPYQDIDETKDARELFPWTPAQRHCTKILYNMMCDNSQPQQTKIEAMRRFFSQFIFHKVGGDKFRSALIHVTAVLGVDEENRRLKERINFSYILAGLTWDMRVLGAELLLPAAKRERQLNKPSWGQCAQ